MMIVPGGYSQRDTRWANELLGHNTDRSFNLANYGCAVTAVSNMLWYMGHPEMNPSWMNNWLKGNGGFLPGGGLLVWSAVNKVSGDIRSQGYTTDKVALNNFIAKEGSFAIVQVKGPGFPMHFVCMPLTNTILDSWDGKLKPLSSYTFVGAHLYGDATPDFVTTPQPPVQTPVTPPAPQTPVDSITPPSAPVVVPPAGPSPESSAGSGISAPVPTAPVSPAPVVTPPVTVPQPSQPASKPGSENPANKKPGVKTSEFWITAAIIAIPLIKHFLGVDVTADQITELGTHIIETISGIAAIAVYVWSRVKVKSN